MSSVAIIGAGPGGLFTADFMTKKFGRACNITIFEASDRPGGKLRTRTFSAAPVIYESGAAEIYDYSDLGEDPFLELRRDLGIETKPMHSETVILDGTPLRDDVDVMRHLGSRTFDAIRAFRQRAARLLPRDRWHSPSWDWDAAHEWASRTFAELLDTIEDPVARRYFASASHSDLATEPHLTSGLTGLRNVVKAIPGYVRIRAVDGGMSTLAHRLLDRLGHCRFERNARVVQVERTHDGWRIAFCRGGFRQTAVFDAVVLALRVAQLAAIRFEGEPLRRAMATHVAAFDTPGHYLRVSLLFRSPFWNALLPDSWFMVDAFGGACVYDESARYDARGHGVLGFLLAGNGALDMTNDHDATLASRVIEALPAALRTVALEQLMEVRVHRWCAGISGQPGGWQPRDPRLAHEPDRERLAGLMLVGDYMFDSTLNGVHRSADLATTLLGSHLMAGTPAREPGRDAVGDRFRPVRSLSAA